MLLSYFNTAAVVIYLMSGIVILIREPRRPLNRLFFLCSLTFAYWTAFNIFIQNPGTDRATAQLLLKIAAPGWIFFPAVVLWLLAELGGFKPMRRPKLRLLSLGPGAIFFVARLDDALFARVMETSFGYTVLWDGGIVGWGFNAYYLIFVGFGLALCLRRLSGSGHPGKRRLARILFVSGLISLAGGGVVNSIISSFWIPGFPRLAHLSYLVFLLGAFWAVRSLSLFVPTLERSVHALVENMEEGIVVTNSDGTIALANPAMAALSGYSLRRLTGMAIGEFLPRWRPTRQGEGAAELFEPFKNRSGKVRRVAVTRRVVEDRMGHLFGIVHVIKDMEALQRLLERVDEANGRATLHARELKKSITKLEGLLQDAGAAIRAKTDFLANMSHEIRTPIASIIGLSRLLGETPLDDSERDLVTTMDCSGTALLAVVDTILLYSRLEAGRVHCAEGAVDLGQILREAVEVFRDRAQDKGLSCDVEIPEGLPVARLDGEKLQRILTELMDNAVKFTDVGRVGVLAEVGGRSSERVLLVEVTDEGEGIPAHLKQHIFTGFSQGDATLTRRHGGTGLGLAIASRLVRMMGGQISVRPNRPRGSRFILDLPLHHVDVPLRERPTETMPQARTAFIVDDNPVSRSFLSLVLEREGIHTKTFGDGASLLAAWSAGARCELLFLDRELPGMSGPQLARSILGAGPSPAEVRIFGVTASSDDAHLTECLENGMEQVFVKPLDRSAIRRVLDGGPGPERGR